MTRNILFVVHGVGRHVDGWSREPDGPVSALNKASELYPSCFRGTTLEDELDMVEIRYDDIFDEHLDQWAQLAQQLKSSPASTLTFNKVNDLLTKVGDDNNLFAAYGGDVLLYTGFELIAKRVRLRVNQIISEKITKATKAALASNEPNPEFGIMGHSLGTTIVHDALHHLATDAWTGKPDDNPFAPPQFMWDCIFMVSNTSRLLHQTKETPYQSSVNTKNGGITRSFYNIEHELDPICQVAKKFRIPADWPNARTSSLDHIHMQNVHAYTHYLQHPAVHRRIFRNLVPIFTGTCNAHAKQLAETYPKYGGEIAALSDDLKLQAKTKLQELISSKKVEVATRLRERFEDLETKLGGLA